ncbi:Rieske (2Fe-2S) protein [Rhodococcoides yunnanense]|uniref:Rieske (2Fe-2S) protein n=1 Tax=Rhodococcoides yunnanense TaxID=278209 RepID=UPI000A009CE9|nr:Rieske 2Fe-2S domain-containing protein [Rhodococcus yunnanensis]
MTDPRVVEPAVVEAVAEVVRPSGRQHVVAHVDEIAPGNKKVVDSIGRHGVGVYNVNGKYYAIANYCPHEGGPLCVGRTHGQTIRDDSAPGGAVEAREGEFIYCPWHQWGFELATGTTAVKPEWSIRTYPVHVDGDDVIVTA